MSRCRAVIAEDEASLRDELRETLAAVWPELDIAAEAADGVQALRALEHHHPDVLFLDIQMPGMTGLDVARHASGRCHIVFVTAYDNYAVSAFDQGAIDYVLKPVTDERLVLTVERLKAKAATPPHDLTALLAQLAQQGAAKRERLQWIKATIGQNLRLIPVADVLYFQSDEKYTRVVTADTEALIKTPIRELLDGLDPEVFWQIHRSTLVNAAAIAGVTRDFRGHMALRLKQRDETLPVSESYAHLFRQM